jgi:hypothetical protein
MNPSDTGQVRKSGTLLNDEAVSARLTTYSQEGAFGRDLQSLWQDAGDAILRATRRHWETVVALPHNEGLSTSQKSR